MNARIQTRPQTRYIPAFMSAVYFLLLVGVLVSVHELGHYVAAKLLDFKVLKLSIGFGPALGRLRGQETEYVIGLIPLGGYVRLLGEDPADEVEDDEVHRSFPEQALWRRLVVVFAGPIANLLCPLLIYFAFFAGHTDLPAAVIGDVFAGGPASAAGLQAGDRVLSIDGQSILYWEELEALVDEHSDDMLRFKIRRGDKTVSTDVTPRQYTIRQRHGAQLLQGLIGVAHAPFQPRIGVLDDQSPAARAGLRTGDLVVSVNGETISRFAELETALRRHSKRALIAFLRPKPALSLDEKKLGLAQLELKEPQLTHLFAETVMSDTGTAKVTTGIVSAEFFVAAVKPGSPAERAGLRPSDLITTLDGVPVTHWLLFDQALQAAPDHAFRVGWLRPHPGAQTEAHEATITQTRERVIDEFGQEYMELVFGATNDFPSGQGPMVPIENRFGYALSHAMYRTGSTLVAMTGGLLSLLSGSLPEGAVGGPIMMYRMASVSGKKGWDAFLLMIALVSVNLGLINLLPIPMLDGGHVLLFAIEAIQRRRLSRRVREVAVMCGLAFIVGITVLALRNDVVHYLLQ